MYKIRTYNSLAAKGLDRFPSENYQVSPEESGADALMLRSQKLHNESIDESVIAVARAGAGVNNIPVDEYAKRGIVVFNTPGANANAVKELVAAALLLGSRDIFGGMSYVQTLDEISDSAEMHKLLEANKKHFAGSEIAGLTLGVVGLGAIGAMVANMALELGMKVAGFDPAISIESAWRLSSRVQKVDSLQALVSVADFVTLHVPAIPPTLGLINEKVLARCKPGARLLNFARDEIVDLPAVVAALDSGRLSAYISDFPHPELLGRKDALLLPHIGASTSEAEENCAMMAADQLMDFLEHGNIRNSVNYPDTQMARNGGYRITFCNENVPKVLGHVLTVLADHNLNVIDMVNLSRGDFAYSIIDVENKPGPGVMSAINAEEHVIRARLLPPA
ncbi:MAG: phosphoglycerate dehydrogenase [Xanthomonadales bacterium]|nr:phosphoglycerate dehydrogenase [Xanthomonadales bacterium]MDH4020222.1 phosphoglycerate dehydrogenase [Xanthomonadales bacterium]